MLIELYVKGRQRVFMPSVFLCAMEATIEISAKELETSPRHQINFTS